MKEYPFIAAARAGANDFWRYVFTVLLVIFIMLIAGSILVAIAIGASGADLSSPAATMPGPLYFALNLAPFLFVWLGLWICMPLLHRRPLISLINPARRFNWRRFSLGAGLWLALSILYNLVFAILKPGYYTWSLDLPAFLPYLLVALLLIPFQAGAEELFYRGYLTQGFGLINGWLGLIFPALLFGLPHLANPEAGTYGVLLTLPVYIGMGLLFGWITLRSGSLEMAMGVHIINNLYATLITTFPSSALKTEVLFTIQNYDALAELAAFFVTALVFVLVFELYLRRAPRPGGVATTSKLLAGLASGALLMSLAACTTATPMPESGPTLALSDCHLSVGAFRSGVSAQCGTLTVPEDRADPEGRQISLNVAVLRAVSRNPEPDPLFLLAGGPGEAATESFVPMIASLEQVRLKRDLVLVDQRGTGKSAALTCLPIEETATPDASTLGAAATPTPIGLEPPRGDQLAEVQSCLDALPEADLTQYTTEIAMQDLDEVRAALGYEQINLLGVSYGTRAALTYARLFPERVRTMTLDGVVPPGWALGSSMRADAQQALNFIFERCMANVDCNQAFPDFENDFYDVLERSQNRLIEVETEDPTTGKKVRVAITPLVVTATVRLMSYSDAQVALLPLMLNSAYQGDYSLLASQYLLMLSSVTSSINTGMYYSVWCYEDLPKLPPEGELGSYYFDPDMGLSRDICGLWPEPGEPRPTRAPTTELTGQPTETAAPAAGDLAAGTPAAGRSAATAAPSETGSVPTTAPAETGTTPSAYPAQGDQTTPGAYPQPGAQASPTTASGVEVPTAGSPAGGSPTAAGTPTAAGSPSEESPSTVGTPDIDWERSFPRTDIPVLIISGEVDPVTPPRNGDEVAALFPNSAHIVLPGMGHANFYIGCMPSLLRDFLDAASTLPLNLDCTRTIQPAPFFLSPVGPQK